MVRDRPATTTIMYHLSKKYKPFFKSSKNIFLPDRAQIPKQEKQSKKFGERRTGTLETKNEELVRQAGKKTGNFPKMVYYKMKHKVSDHKLRKYRKMNEEIDLRDSAQLDQRKFVKCCRLKFLETHVMLYTTVVYNVGNKQCGQKKKRPEMLSGRAGCIKAGARYRKRCFWRCPDARAGAVRPGTDRL